MFYETIFRLALKQQDQVIAFALLESFGIHATIILNFMFNITNDKNDAIASHYLLDKDAWKRISSKYRKELNFIFIRRNKELAHLSYERRNVKQSEKQWNFVAIGREVSELIDHFIDSSDKCLLHPNVVALKGYFRNHSICKAIPNLQNLPLINGMENIVKSREFNKRSGTLDLPALTGLLFRTVSQNPFGIARDLPSRTVKKIALCTLGMVSLL